MQDNKNENNPVEDGIKFNTKLKVKFNKIRNSSFLKWSAITRTKVSTRTKDDAGLAASSGDKDAKNNGSASNCEVESTDGSKSTPFKRPPLKRNLSVQKWSAITRTKVFSPQIKRRSERSNGVSIIEDVNQVF